MTSTFRPPPREPLVPSLRIVDPDGVTMVSEPLEAPSSTVSTPAAVADQLAALVDEADLADQQIKARIRARLYGGTYEPLKIGHLTVLHKVGSGGMGAVYAAYDDQLDRKVALKLLHSAQAKDERAMARLLREAQALAQLSHPNLVPVFEAGRFDAQVYLVMELVDGVTMRQWLDQQRRPWTQILTHWLDVGRALVAVHAAKLVHRDVKPSNVVVGFDGRPRLVDFGLARPTEGQISASTVPDDRDGASGDTPAPSTMPSAVAGTPAYMPPEVLSGAAPDAHADQYSLCVSIYESLYRERPPLYETATPSTPRKATRVPAAVRTVLQRGLRRDPNERYPSVAMLVTALERAAGRPWRTRSAWGMALVAAASIGGLSAHAIAPVAATNPCATAGEQIEATWSPARRAAVAQAFAATDLPYATALTEGITEQLDAYAAAWSDADLRICEAMPAQQDRPDVVVRRRRCLDRQHGEFGALVHRLGQIDADTALTAASAVARLRVPDDCTLPSLAASGFPPLRADQRAVGEQLHATLATLDVGLAFDPWKQTVAQAEEVLGQAETLDDPRLVAEASLLLGQALLRRRDPSAREHLDRADNLAEAHGDLLTKESARHQLDQLATDVGGDLPAAWRALERYEATVDALGRRPHHVLRAHTDRARVLLMAGRPRAAERELQAALTTADEVGRLADRPRVNALTLLAMAQSMQGRKREALQTYADARSVDTQWGIELLDPAGRRLIPGRIDHHQGHALALAGELERADTHLRRALQTAQRQYGSDSLPVAETLVALVDLEVRRGNTAQAEAHATRADAIMRRWLDPRHERRSQVLSAIGAVAFDQGRYGDALEAFEQMLEIELAIRVPNSFSVAVAHNNVGEALVLLERPERAREHLSLALGGLRTHLPPDHVQLAFPLKALALIDLAAEDFDTAATRLERALALHQGDGHHAVELARTQWALARARAGQGRRSQAQRLASAALAGYQALGPGAGESLRAETNTVAAWLDDFHSPR